MNNSIHQSVFYTSILLGCLVLTGTASGGLRPETWERHEVLYQGLWIPIEVRTDVVALSLRRGTKAALVEKELSPYFTRLTDPISNRYHAQGHTLVLAYEDSKPRADAERRLEEIARKHTDGIAQPVRYEPFQETGITETMILNQVIVDVGDVEIDELRARLEGIGRIEETVFDRSLVTSTHPSLDPLKFLKKVTQALDGLVPPEDVYSNNLRLVDSRGR